MDALKSQLLRIQQQLTGLSASQKMLTASLVIIMVMTMFYWSRYASSPEMAILLDQSLSADEIAQMKSSLSAKNVNYQVQGDRILVPADKKFELIADLGYEQLLPHDLKDGFSDIFLANDNVFSTQSQKDQLMNHSKEVSLSRIIARWPGVKTATVIIDSTRRFSPGRSIEPSAAVAIWMKDGNGTNKKLVEAAADLISGSSAGMPRHNVKVSVNGSPAKVNDPDSDNGFSGDNPILEAKARHEQYYADKILNQLSYIAGVHAVVSVDLRTQTSWTSSKKVDPKNKVEGLKRSVTVTSENTSSTPAGEPGAVSNLSLGIEGSNTGSGENSTSEKTEIENVVDTGVEHVTTNDPAGNAKPVTAGVRIPASYFAGVWKIENPGEKKEPTLADLDIIVARETPHIRDAVRMATNISVDADISVAKYIDIAQPVVGADAAVPGLAALPTGFGFGIREIAIGVLAIISLFMVSMMVRKSNGQPVLAASTETDFNANDRPAPSPPGDMTAELEEGGMLMTGHEMSDDAVQARQVIEQVGTMIDDDPDVAAALIKRWLNR